MTSFRELGEREKGESLIYLCVDIRRKKNEKRNNDVAVIKTKSNVAKKRIEYA